MDPGLGRPRARLVYVNSFGSHRCGSLIRYGRGCPQAAARQDGTPRSQLTASAQAERPPEPGDEARPDQYGSRRPGDLQEVKSDTFDFPFPSRNVDKVIKRKKQKSQVWHKVQKVISKMLEENEKFRSQLLACSQLNGEGNDTNPSSQDEMCCLDGELSIFGWV